MTRAMRRGAGAALAVLVGGCATKQPVATNLVDSQPMPVKLERRAFQEAALTITDPATGETFTGRIPGSRPQVGIQLGGGQTTQFQGMSADGTLFSGTARTSAPTFIPQVPADSTGLLRGDKGNTLICRFYFKSENAICVKPDGGFVYLDF
jgi:hypothetical protein